MNADVTGKASLRTTLRSRLRAISPLECEQWSRRIQAHLLETDDGISSAPVVVALFGGLRGEADLLPLLEPVRQCGGRPVFFAVQEDELVAYEVAGTGDLVRGVLGVWEPRIDPARLVAASELTVVLTPGLAFGREDGSRLGRGAGFYDRLFAKPGVTARRIGIGFDCQLLDRVPVEAHDARLEAIVTESGWRRF